MLEDRIDECKGKLLSLEGGVSGVTPASVISVDTSAAAPMDEDPSETAASMLDRAYDEAPTEGVAETQFFMQVHQKIIEAAVTGTGITGGGDALSETLLEKFKKVMATVLQDVGDYSAITHTQIKHRSKRRLEITHLGKREPR